MKALADTHAHLLSDRYRNDLAQVLRRAEKAGVRHIINVGTDLASSEAALSMGLPECPRINSAVGIHPHYAGQSTERDYRGLGRLARSKTVVALGEMGLDYYRDLSPREIQKRCFSRQLSLAHDLSLPIIVHNREAAEDVYRILRDEGQGLKGVLHCFSENWEWAQRFMDLGFHLSLAGPVTYPNALDAREIARLIPLDRLLVETDCPYLPPQVHRGKRNEPAFVEMVVDEIARIRGEEAEEIARITLGNAEELFGLGS